MPLPKPESLNTTSQKLQMVHRSLLVGSNFSSIQKRKTRKTIRHLSVYKLTSLHYPQTRNLLALLLDMNNSSPNWGDMSGTKTSDIWESSNHSDMSLLPDSGVSDIPNSWFQRSTSTFSSACEGDNIQDIFKVLSDVELPTQGNSSMETIIKFLSEPEEVGRKRKAGEKDIPKCLSSETAGVSTETKGKQDVQHKRIRSAEEHNKSERMRRDRINVKLRALQELIPNCNKSDRASMLDDAIEYVKAMKLQVHMMSMGGSALCQVPYISPTSIQTVQVPGFSPLLQMKPGLGFSMGMTGMGYNPSFPLASPSASSEFPVMSFSGDPSAPQFQVPFFPSQQLPVNAAMHAMQPRINPIFCHPNQGQGEPVSRNIPRMTATHLPQAPLIPQNSDSSRHPSPLTHGTTTSLRRRRGRSH